MAPILGISFFLRALCVPAFLVGAYRLSADPADAACHKTVDAAGKAPAEERSYEVYNHCRTNRPAGGIVGEADATNDCTQMAHLYEVAAHYSKGSDVSSADFCATVEEYRKDTEDSSGKKLLAEHGGCTVFVKQMLMSREVGEAVESSCKRLFPGTAPAKCAQYAKEIHATSGEAEVSQICDKHVRGHATASLEEQKFIYSCVQYASNLIASQKDTSPETRAATKAEVEKSCRSHLPAEDQGFCDEYSDLIQKRASRAELETFCDAEYKKIHSGKENGGTVAPSSTPLPAKQTSTTVQTSTAVPSSTIAMHGKPGKVQPAAVSGIVHLGMDFPAGAILMNHVASNKSSLGASKGGQAACEEHMGRIAKVPLPTNSKKVVIQKECLQRYKKSARVCADAAHSLLVGDAVAACHLLSRQDNPINKTTPDMVTMCKETVASVSSLDLLGEALRQTAVDMCAQDLAASLHKPATTPSISKGCNFFGDIFADAYSKGPVDTSTFCSSLAEAEYKPAVQHAPAQEAEHKPAVASKAKRHEHNKKPSVSLLRQTQKEEVDDSENDEDFQSAATSHGSETDQGSFLNSFLDGYDVKKDGATIDEDEGQKNKITTDEGSEEDGALDDASSATQDAGDPLASVEKAVLHDRADKDDSASIEDAPPAAESAPAEDDTEVAKPQAPSSSLGDGDVDSLVSSFLQRTT